jgi:hypothetical protein
MIVRVYKNLTRGCYSIQWKELGKGWRLFGHGGTIYLKDCRFVVYQHARKRVLLTKQKNVHAFVEGELEDIGPPIHNLEDLGYQKVSYNPYTGEDFRLTLTQTPIRFASFVALTPTGVFAQCL